MRKCKLNRMTSTGALVLALSAGGAFAGDQTWNFDDAQNPTNGFTIVGGHANYYYATGGNPDSGGYLSIADGVSSGQALVVVFPDIDAGYPVKAFHLTMDVRAGNGNTERPADGFSISYCREGDPVLKNATNGAAGGAAGGDSAAAAIDPAGSGDFENGTKTGVSICFDAWAGNWLPDTGAGGVPGPDTEGIEVRVDDHTLKQIDMSADRNGGCSLGATNDISACSNNVCGDFNTEQTGPWINDGGSPTPLCWAPLDVELDTNKQVTVIWKGHVFLDHFQLGSYSSHRGRLILMGRNGDNDQNVHFDNIHLVTTPAVEATFGGLQAGPSLNQFTFTINDNGSSIVTNISVVKLDGVDVTSQINVTKSGDTTTGVYNGANRFASASKHTVDITWQTSLGQTLSAFPTPTFTVANWTVLSAAMAVPANSIDLNQPGFRVVSHQTSQSEPNRMYWADQQLEGLHGTNGVDYSLLNTVNGEISWSDVIDFGNAAGSVSGEFQPDRDWVNFGLPALGYPNDNNSAVAVMTYLYFPQAGTYVMGGNSDDSLRVTVAKNSHDLLGTQVQGLFSDVGRGISSDENVGTIIVDTPGYYGFRLLFENGGGGCALEWYFKSTPAGTTNVLINDTLNNPDTAIKAYQVSSAAPPYVSFANPPLNDDQVFPDQTLKYQLTDGSTAVNSGSVSLKVNGVAQAPSVNKAGSVTTITQTAPASFWPKGTNSVELSFTDSLGTNYDYQYTFAIGPYVTLDPGPAVPLGSQDTTKPGFVLSSSQIDFATVNDSGDGIATQVDEANAMIAGLFFPWYGANVSTVPGPTAWPGVVDFNIVTSPGDFTNDFTLPGIPGTAAAAGNNFAVFFQFWLAFPSPGFYRMGVSSDDGFRVSEGFAPLRQVLHVTGNGINTDVGAVVSQTADGNGGFGVPLPVNPITAPVVFVSSNTCPNLPDLTGKIAVADHLLCGNNDAALTLALQNAGAVAAIIINPPNFGFPYVMTGNPGGDVTIPALNVNGFGGQRDFWITNANLTATIGASQTIQLGSADYGKGMGAIDFGVAVPQAGVYPLNLIYEEGGGGAGLEFSQILSDGTRILVNDTNNPTSLKAFRAVTAVARPTISINSSGGVTKITYTGTLQSAPTVNGTYGDVQGASSPYTVPTSSGTMQFYRSR